MKLGSRLLNTSMANGNLTTSNLGIELVQHFESLHLTAYLDPVGIWTIGYGTIRIGGARVVPGMSCTKDQAIQWLAADVVTAEKDVQRLTQVSVQQSEFDALVSFTYNVGGGNLSQSTLLKRINTHTPVVEKHFTDWNKGRVDGSLVPLAGLTRRRKAEFHLYSTGTLKFQF